MNERKRERELLIPWGANQTLDDDERAELEALLEDSLEARELYALASGHASDAASLDEGRLAGTVHPRLLLEYFDDRDALDDDTIRFVEERLDNDPLTRACAERLAEVDAALTRAERPLQPVARRPRPSWFTRVWDALSASLLRPVPALAYLAAFVVAVVALVGPEDERPDELGVFVPGVRLVEGETTLRAESPAERIAPVRLDAPTLLELSLGLEPSDLERAGLSLDLEIARDDDTLEARALVPSELRVRDERVYATVLLDPRRLAPGEYALIVRARRPGDVLDGAALFRRRVLVLGESR